MNRLMPSTPTMKRVPSPGIHGRFSTNWNPSGPVLKCHSKYAAQPGGGRGERVAHGLDDLGATRGDQQRDDRADRGRGDDGEQDREVSRLPPRPQDQNSTQQPCRGGSRARSAAPARPRPCSAACRTTRTVGHAVDRAVDDLLVEHPVEPRGRRASGAADEPADALVVVVGVAEHLAQRGPASRGSGSSAGARKPRRYMK